ncbi:hypothetical protein CR513_20993, partial [Mucuna pruriens]
MLVTCNQAANSSNGEEEDTLQRLLQAVASLQAPNDEQTRLNAKAEQREEIDETTIPPNFREVMQQSTKLQVIPRDPTRCNHKILQRHRNLFRLLVRSKQDKMLGSGRPLRHLIE